MHNVGAFICEPGREASPLAKRLVHLTLDTKPGQPLTQAHFRQAIDSTPANAGATILAVHYGEFSDVPFDKLPKGE